MPGLTGFTDLHHKYDGDMLSNMRALLKHYDHYVDEQRFSDERIYASRTHLGLIYQGEQPYICENRFLSWFDGEFYNQEDLRSKYETNSENDNELMVRIYNSTRSFKFLKDIDGYFSSVLYDKKDNQIHLITDRYGLKPLFWGKIGDDIVWSSELKGFLEHKNFKPVIDPQAVKEFFEFGYLLENRTWFEGIELLPPASVLSFHFLNSKFTIQNYWTWTDIKPIEEPFDEKELAEELGALFKKAVCRRVNKEERIGITLSGGLDSRAILAAFPEDHKPLHTFTFGLARCDDIRIAKKASKTKGAEHHALELNSINWLRPRISGVWKSDASFNLLDMHGIEFYEEYKLYMDFNLNGFLGDAILGGSYISEGQTMEYKLRNRGRRFINQALVVGESWLVHRKPFLDKDLSTFILSVPETVRKDSYIYKKMLLSTFPEYFNDIPWQKTGYPISYSKRIEQVLKFRNRITGRLKRESERFGFKFKERNNYTDYPSWTRQKPAKSFFERVLLNKSALYPKYIDRNQVHNLTKDHMGRIGNHHYELCLLLTFELWLQQVFEARYRE